MRDFERIVGGCDVRSSLVVELECRGVAVSRAIEPAATRSI